MASVKRRPNGRWRARWIDPEGRERARHFATRAEAEQFLATTVADIARGTWLDPAAGRVTFGEYAETWRLAQLHRPTTAEATESRIRNHMGVWHDRPLGSIRPTEVQAWAAKLAGTLAPGTVRAVVYLFASIMRAAVIDRLIPESPATRVKLPKADRAPVVPLETVEVQRIAETIRADLAGAVWASAMGGLRVGEVTGLTVDRVDFLRRTILVDRQVRWIAGGGWEFGPPKTSASRRVVPVPEALTDRLAAHVAEHGTGPDGLLFHHGGGPFRRRRVGEALTAAKATGTWHDFRHFYASALIGAGLSVKVVQARLGHATAAETLDTYAHLWPSDDDRTRDAITGVFEAAADRSRTSEAESG